jgi:hypothetical protein
MYALEVAYLVWVCLGGKTKQLSTTYLKTKKILDIPSTWIDKSKE